MSKPPNPRERKVFDGGFLVLCALTLCAGLGVVLSTGWGRLAEIVLETGGFLLVLSPKILAGIFVAASLPVLVPQHQVVGWIGRESGLRGLLVAATAGVVIPGGPMMIYALAAGFATAGADIGATVAFVTGWSLLSLNRTVIWEMSFLHADIVALRVLLCLPVPILCGFAARWLIRRRIV
ncbi:MAG: hypothetical protein AAF245_00640 [Pseudomonadota bacterium]